LGSTLTEGDGRAQRKRQVGSAGGAKRQEAHTQYPADPDGESLAHMPLEDGAAKTDRPAQGPAFQVLPPILLYLASGKLMAESPRAHLVQHGLPDRRERMQQPALPAKGTECMDLGAVGTAPSPQPEAGGKPLEIPQYMTMAPQPDTVAAGITPGTLPPVAFSLSLQFIWIHVIIKYYVFSMGSRHLWLEVAPLSSPMMSTYYHIMLYLV